MRHLERAARSSAMEHPDQHYNQTHNPVITIRATASQILQVTTTYTTLLATSTGKSFIEYDAAPSNLSGADKAGIALGCLVFVVIVGMLAWVLYVKLRCRRAAQGKTEEGEENDLRVGEVEERLSSEGDEDNQSSLSDGSPKLDDVARYESMNFDARSFSVERERDEDEILPVRGPREPRVMVRARTSPHSPTPKERNISNGSVIWTPGKRELDTTPTQQHEREPHAEGDSPLPGSLTAGRPPSADWPFPAGEAPQDGTVLSTPRLQREGIPMTSIAAPGYTCANYTPSKYQPSPPIETENKNNDINLRPRPQSWPLSDSTPPVSPLKFQDVDAASEYQSSPPPTLPNAARPLSLVQEYSLATFPVSPCPPTDKSPNEGGMWEKVGGLMPLDFPAEDNDTGGVDLNPESPSPKTQLKSAVGYALAALETKGGGEREDHGLSENPFDVHDEMIEVKDENESARSMQQTLYALYPDSPYPPCTTITPSKIKMEDVPATPKASLFPPPDRPLPALPQQKRTLWGESEMEPLFLTASRRDATLQREREREREEDDEMRTALNARRFSGKVEEAMGEEGRVKLERQRIDSRVKIESALYEEDEGDLPADFDEKKRVVQSKSSCEGQ
ncbi:uncharacterized protein RCC_03010 [Ramularia collo-cygni]|uniref:Uncharacterized protein n=1 Tax=Ramularia collo-cygni TaxID=112498 RepID=A0A2D3URI9_9PEZI|nr:uncharacterized protein RCC_03010 [Ramularia collo-cygni]CZT17178.1 uncharacterized protein RCC_03010 [Ramularia collo-cygni]